MIPALLIACATTTACVQEIEIENAPGHVTTVGPLELDERGNVNATFTLHDLEGDDQRVVAVICDAPDETCGPALEAAGSEPLDRLPTVPKATDVLHEFRWQPWCGRYLNGEPEPAQLDSEYVIGFAVVRDDAETVYSEPFSLSALGAAEAGDCP